MNGTTNSKGAASTAPMPSVSVFAIGAKGYTLGAANLAASIAHHAPDVRVKLYTDGNSLKHLKQQHLDLFHTITTIGNEHYMTDGRIDPGKMKCRIADLVQDDETVYIDADSIAVKDIRPFLLALASDGRDYITECIEGYLPWASAEKVRAKLGMDDARIMPIQSSWAFIRKCDFFDTVRRMCDEQLWKREELDHKWGRSLPDELIYTSACAARNVDPGWRNEMLFGNKIVATTIDEVCEKFTMMTLYGNGIGRPHVRDIYITMYDRILHDVFKARLMNHYFKSNYILHDKYLN
jgi:hypothetical protein